MCDGVYEILYCDRTVPQKYDQDGNVISNWNSEGPFEDCESVNVAFRIRTPSYYHPVNTWDQTYMFETVGDRAAFYKEVSYIFKSMGWNVSGQAYMEMDGSHLFVHPLEIRGKVKKWEVPYIAEKIVVNASLFWLTMVELFGENC